MLGISGFKLMIILVAGLILIGPDKMPEIARTIGKALHMFNEAKDNMENIIRADMFSTENLDTTSPEAAVAKTASASTVASTLYDNDEDEEEEEE